jgi:hypothetical protein
MTSPTLSLDHSHSTPSLSKGLHVLKTSLSRASDSPTGVDSINNFLKQRQSLNSSITSAPSAPATLSQGSKPIAGQRSKRLMATTILARGPSSAEADVGAKISEALELKKDSERRQMALKKMGDSRYNATKTTMMLLRAKVEKELQDKQLARNPGSKKSSLADVLKAASQKKDSSDVSVISRNRPESRNQVSKYSSLSSGILPGGVSPTRRPEEEDASEDEDERPNLIKDGIHVVSPASKREDKLDQTHYMKKTVSMSMFGPGQGVDRDDNGSIATFSKVEKQKTQEQRRQSRLEMSKLPSSTSVVSMDSSNKHRHGSKEAKDKDQSPDLQTSSVSDTEDESEHSEHGEMEKSTKDKAREQGTMVTPKRSLEKPKGILKTRSSISTPNRTPKTTYRSGESPAQPKGILKRSSSSTPVRSPLSVASMHEHTTPARAILHCLYDGGKALSLQHLEGSNAPRTTKKDSASASGTSRRKTASDGSKTRPTPTRQGSSRRQLIGRAASSRRLKRGERSFRKSKTDDKKESEKAEQHHKRPSALTSQPSPKKEETKLHRRHPSNLTKSEGISSASMRDNPRRCSEGGEKGQRRACSSSKTREGGEKGRRRTRSRSRTRNGTITTRPRRASRSAARTRGRPEAGEQTPEQTRASSRGPCRNRHKNSSRSSQRSEAELEQLAHHYASMDDVSHAIADGSSVLQFDPTQQNNVVVLTHDDKECRFLDNMMELETKGGRQGGATVKEKKVKRRSSITMKLPFLRGSKSATKHRQMAGSCNDFSVG